MRFLGLKEYNDGSIFIETADEDYSNYENSLLIWPNDKFYCAEQMQFKNYSDIQKSENNVETKAVTLRRIEDDRSRLNRIAHKLKELDEANNYSAKNEFIKNALVSIRYYYDEIIYNDYRGNSYYYYEKKFDKYMELFKTKCLPKYEHLIDMVRDVKSRYKDHNDTDGDPSFSIVLNQIYQSYKHEIKDPYMFGELVNSACALDAFETNDKCVYIINPALFKFLVNQSEHQEYEQKCCTPCGLLNLLPSKNLCIFTPGSVIFVRPDYVIIPVDGENTFERKEILNTTIYRFDDFRPFEYYGIPIESYDYDIYEGEGCDHSIVGVLLYLISTNTDIVDYQYREYNIKLVGSNIRSISRKSTEQLLCGSIPSVNEQIMQNPYVDQHRNCNFIITTKSHVDKMEIKWDPIYYNVKTERSK